MNVISGYIWGKSYDLRESLQFSLGDSYDAEAFTVTFAKSHAAVSIAKEVFDGNGS